MHPWIYLDNAATTPVKPEVFETMEPYFEEFYGNPSGFSSFADTSKEALETARKTVADFLGAKPGEIYFTSGGSIFTFDIKGGQREAWVFIDHLKIFSLFANVADVKSLVIHPATTTHSQLSAEELLAQGIKPNTIRLSIGTENVLDLIDDLAGAFEAVAHK